MDGYIGFIGAGHITEMLISGIMRKEAASPSAIIVSDVDAGRVGFMNDKFGIGGTNDNGELFEKCDSVFFCLHPPIVRKVVADLAGSYVAGKMIVSVAAGVTMDTYRPMGNVAVLRALPNPPAKVGCGIIPYACNEFVDAGMVERVLKLLSSLGECFPASEDLISVAASLTSPAAPFLFMDSLVEAGILAGASRQDSVRMVRKTMQGCLKMLEVEPEKSIADFLAEACTPGGISVETLFAMDRYSFRAAVKDGILKGAEKARGFSGK